jgi:hypothetical protein
MIFSVDILNRNWGSQASKDYAGDRPEMRQHPKVTGVPN